MLGIALAAGLLIGFVVPEEGGDSSAHFLSIRVKELKSSLEIEQMWRAEYKKRWEKEKVARKAERTEREHICQARVDRLWKTKAGEVCWAENERLVKQLEEEKKLYHWSLKFCGAITEKTPVQIKRYEKKVQELTENEEEKMED
jgi:hypothetical protein